MASEQIKPYLSYDGPMNDKKQRHGEGLCVYNDGTRYEGSFQNDKRHGRGTLYYPEGTKLVGEFRDDEANGEGTLLFKNGDKYEGTFKDGKMDGRGVFDYEEDKRKYVGEFKAGLKHGKGEYYFANGSRYMGDFHEDMKHGEGTFYYADGSRYEGCFQRGKREGQGKYFYANGDSYEGQFKADKKCGHGTERYSSGHVYIGQFKDGRRHGQGSFFYKDGGRYVGEHAFDKADGKGKEYYKDGGRYEGTFKKGEKHGHGIFYYPDDSRYDGEFRKNKRDGEGTYYYSNGNRYEGQWVDNLRSGQGVLYYADGGKYEGYFKNDKMNGRGIMSYADGKRYEVEYEFGVEIRRRPLVQRREELRRRLLKKMEMKMEGKHEEKGVSEQQLQEREEAANKAFLELLKENEVANCQNEKGGQDGKGGSKSSKKKKDKGSSGTSGGGAAQARQAQPEAQGQDQNQNLKGSSRTEHNPHASNLPGADQASPPPTVAAAPAPPPIPPPSSSVTNSSQTPAPSRATSGPTKADTGKSGGAGPGPGEKPKGGKGSKRPTKEKEQEPAHEVPAALGPTKHREQVKEVIRTPAINGGLVTPPLQAGAKKKKERDHKGQDKSLDTASHRPSSREVEGNHSLPFSQPEDTNTSAVARKVVDAKERSRSGNATQAAMTAAAMDAAFGVPEGNERREKKRAVVIVADSEDEEGSQSDHSQAVAGESEEDGGEESQEGDGEPTGGYKSEVTFVAVGPKLRSGRRCKSVEIKARVEPGDQQVTVSFALTPPDTSIGKFMVLCTTVGGKAIKSKKVGNPLAVIKGLTNGERYLFIVAVQDAARVRYDAPTMLSTIPGTPIPPSSDAEEEPGTEESLSLPVPLSPGLLGITEILEEDPLSPTYSDHPLFAHAALGGSASSSVHIGSGRSSESIRSGAATTGLHQAPVSTLPVPLEPLWKEIHRMYRERSLNELTFFLSTASKHGPHAALVLGQQESRTGALLLRRVESEAELVGTLRCAQWLQEKATSRNLAVLDSFAVDRARGAFFLLTQSQAVPVSAWIDRNQAKLRGLMVQFWEEDLALRLRIAVQTARALVAMEEVGLCPRRLAGESVTVDDEVATVVVAPDVLPCPVTTPSPPMDGMIAALGLDPRMRSAVSAVKQYGHLLIHLFTGRRPSPDGSTIPLAVSCSDILFGDSLPSGSTTLAAGASAPAAGGSGVAVAGGYLDELPDLKELVERCLEDEGVNSMAAVLMAIQTVQNMRCAKVALERVEKRTGQDASGWVLRPRQVCLYISPGAVSEIISKVQTLPDRRPYNMWGSKLLACLNQALQVYESWVLAMSAGECDPKQVERMLAILSVMLPRTFCEATSKAFITALDLPFLFTSYEAFKHVRDHLMRYHQSRGVAESPRLSVENQKRVDCLNNLLYLRGLSAGEYTHHDRAVEASCPLVTLPTTLADEILGVFTDIYRTLHALGFEEATSFDSVVQVVRATSDGQRANVFLEGLGTEP